MSERRLRDYLDHMLEAARLACSYIEGMDKEEFLADQTRWPGRAATSRFAWRPAAEPAARGSTGSAPPMPDR